MEGLIGQIEYEGILEEKRSPCPEVDNCDYEDFENCAHYVNCPRYQLIQGIQDEIVGGVF